MANYYKISRIFKAAARRASKTPNEINIWSHQYFQGNAGPVKGDAVENAYIEMMHKEIKQRENTIATRLNSLNRQYLSEWREMLESMIEEENNQLDKLFLEGRLLQLNLMLNKLKHDCCEDGGDYDAPRKTDSE